MLKCPNRRRNRAIATSRSADRAGFSLGFSLVRICTSAAQRAAAARLDSHTLRLAVKPSGRPSEGLYISLNKFCDQVNHIFEGCHYNKGIPVEVTVTVDIFVKVPIISRASLAESTVATATRRTTTVPRTKEWKLQTRFKTGEDRGLQLKASPKGPARTAQRELEADSEGHSMGLGKARGTQRRS